VFTGLDTGSGRGVLRGLALGLALLVGGCTSPATVSTQLEGGSATYPPFVVEPPVRFMEADPREPSRTPAAHPAPPHPAVGVPRRLLVPRLGVNAPVVGIDAPNGILVPPSDPTVLGWWRRGARPGARYGGALITGHTVSTGGGAFDDLETLASGDQVRVRTDRGTIRYRVSAVTVYRKASLARDAARVFSQKVPGRLVLITCEDWNGTVYLSNAVVFADPV
jgi:hypothetical protein